MKRMPPIPHRAARGVALVVILWILVLITIVVGTYTILAHTENLQSRFLFDTTQARYAAESGIHRAVLELRSPDMETRWVGDGRTYAMEFGGAVVEIQVINEAGKIDLNSADEELLTNLFVSRGVDEMTALHLTDAILDWREPGDLPRLYGAKEAEYFQAGYPYGPPGAPFETVDELQQVIGMTWELFQEVEPALTINGGRVNPAFAPLEALLALPDMDYETAMWLIQEREMYHPSDGMPIILPDGTQVMASLGGVTYSIRSRATLDNGIWAEVEATIQLGTDELGRPFRVLRWRENLEN